jgi:hypothetical protein
MQNGKGQIIKYAPLLLSVDDNRVGNNKTITTTEYHKHVAGPKRAEYESMHTFRPERLSVPNVSPADRQPFIA